MAVKKVHILSRDDLPEKKLNITKEWMLEWLSKYGSLEDLEWFDKVCRDNPATFQSNLPELSGQTYEVSDWAKVRSAFLKRFFPTAFTKKPQAKKQQEKYMDRLQSLIAKKRMEEQQLTLDETAAGTEPAEPEQATPAPRGRRKQS